MDAAEFLTSNKYKNKKVEGSVVSIPVFKSMETKIRSHELLGKSENLRTFLRWVHILSVLTKWRHNRAVIGRLYGPNFGMVFSEALRSLTAETNGVMIQWSQLHDRRGISDMALVSLTNAILSAAVGLGQFVTRFACADQDQPLYDIAVGAAASQPWSIREFSSRGLGLFLKPSGPATGKGTPEGGASESNSRAHSASPLPHSRANSSNSRASNTPPPPPPPPNATGADGKGQEKVNGETVQNLVTLLWKLHDFANVMVAGAVPEGEIDPFGLRGIRTLLLVLQGQVLHSLATYLAVFPGLVKNFRTVEGHGVIQSLLSLGDIIPGQPLSALDAELLMQRFMLVLHCQDVGMDANIKSAKNIGVSVTDLERTLLNMKPVFQWLSRRCDEEAAAASASSSFLSDKTVASLFVECKCAQILRTRLPNTDLYPWDASSTASAMHCGNMTTRRESACSALTNIFKAYWAERQNSFPIDGVQVFEPSKTLLFSLAGNDPEYGTSNLSAAGAQKSEVPFFREHLSLPAACMMNHLLSKIFLLAWKYTRTTYSLPDKMVYIKAALRMLSEALESCMTSSYAVVFLMNYMLFIGRCIRHSPQQMILVCRSQRIWKMLLKLGGITSAAKSANILSAEFSNKFMNVTSTLAGTDQVAPESSPIDDLIYHVQWRYSADGNDGTQLQQQQSQQQAMPFTPSRNVPAAMSNDEADDHFVEHAVGHSGSLDNSDLSSSRPVSVDSNTSPGIFSRKHLNSMDTSFVSMDTNSEGTETESPKSPRHGVGSTSHNTSTSNAAPSASLQSSPARASEREEFLVFFSHYVIKDMIMELIRICSHFSFLVHALMDTSVDSYLFLEYEANELTEALTAETSDDAIILIIRWLSDLADFHNQIFIQSSIWTNATKKCIALSKSLLDSLNTFVASTASYSGDILQARPLFWPARAATVQLISKIIYSPCSKDWLDAFLPRLEDAPTLAAPSTGSSAAAVASGTVAPDPDRRRSMSESISRAMMGPRKATVLAAAAVTAAETSNAAAATATAAAQNVNSISRPVRHTVIIRLILDPLCRDYAVSIIAKILQTCAEVLHPFPVVDTAASNAKITKPSMIEALAHDVIKGLLNTMIAAPQQPEVNDGVGAVVLSLQALIVLLRNPLSLNGERDQHFPFAAYQRIFTNYGTLTPSHQLLGWNYNRYNIFRDLLASLNASFKRSVWDNQQKRKIMHYSLTLMTAIMVGNEAHKDVFWQLLMQKTKKKSSNMMLATSATHSHSYHDLISMLVSSRDGETVAMETVLLLFEMLLDGFAAEFRQFLWDTMHRKGELLPVPEGFFEKAADVPTMSNLSTIPLLLNISYFCSEDLQCCLMNSLNNCIGGSSNTSMINLSACLQMKPPIFDMVLDVFPNLSASAQRASMKLLQVLGRYTVNVAQLKRLFRLLHLKDNVRPSYTLTLLEAMEGMILTAQAPRTFFFFQGKESGLRLPAFRKWPAAKGFSFSTWFCIDSPKALNGGKSEVHEGARADLKYNPRLLCFRQDSGFGFELYFKAHEGFPNAFSVMYTVFGTAGAHTVEIGVVARSRGKGRDWHHLALAHTASNFRSKSELLVLINSKRLQHTISYPRYTDEVRYPTIGDVSPNFHDEGSITTFFGQVAPVYFFSEALPEVYLQGIYELGPNYSQLFSDKDGMALSLDSAVQRGPNFTRVQDGFLSAAIMLTYNPALRRGNIIIDNTPEKNVNLWRPSRFTEEFADTLEASAQDNIETGGSEETSSADSMKRMHALRLKGTYVFSTRDVRDSFDCLGGVKVLLPLFTQLSSAADQLKSTDDPELQSEIYFKILKLHCSFLRGTPENHRLMDQFGFNLLSHFMDTLGPQYLTVNVQKELVRWSESLHWNEHWQNDFMRDILCNFKLWKYSSFEVQLNLFDYLQSMTLANSNRMHAVVTVPALVDALYLFYGGASEVAVRSSSAKGRAEEGLVPHEWKAHFSLDASELRNIRGVIVNMIYVMISTASEPIEDDIGMLMNYLVLEQAPGNLVEVLKILLQMVNVDRPDLGHRVLAAMVNKGGMQHLLDLIPNASARVRMYSLLCICSVVHFALVHSKLPAQPVVTQTGEKAPVSTTGARNKDFSRADESTLSDMETSNVSSSSAASTSRAAAATLNRSTYSLKIDAAAINSRSNPSMKIDGVAGGASIHEGEMRDEVVSGKDKEGTDIFEALGIPASSLTGVFLWMQNKLKAAMKKDVFCPEAAERQCYIIFTALCLTMFGLPAKKLAVQVEHMYAALQKVGVSEGGGGAETPVHRTPSMTLLQVFTATLANEADHTLDQEFDIDTASWRICVPMILPALFSLIQLETINSTVRIRLLLRLKGCVNNVDNFDIFLSIPNWQAYIFNCLAIEQSRIDFLEAYRGANPAPSPTTADSVDHIEKEFYESQNIIDVLISVMSDIHIHSIQFGQPSASYFAINRPKEVRDIQFHNMATKELLQLMQKDNRKVGCIGKSLVSERWHHSVFCVKSTVASLTAS